VVSVEVGGPQPSSEGSVDTISESDTGAMVMRQLYLVDGEVAEEQQSPFLKSRIYFVERLLGGGAARFAGIFPS